MLTCEITRKTCNKRQHRKSKTRAATHLVSAFFDRAEAAAGDPGGPCGTARTRHRLWEKQQAEEQ